MKKTVCMLLCLALLLPCLSGCGDTEPLQVWCAEGTENFVQQAAYMQKQIDDKFACEVTVFREDAAAGDGFALTQDLQSQLMAGEGPDLVLFTEEDFTDVRKLTESGCFLDLSGYLENSEKIDPEEYIEGIFTDGCVGEMCHYLPLGFTAVSYLTTGMTLADNGWTEPETLTDVLQQGESIVEGTGGYTYLMCPMTETDWDYAFEFLFRASGLELIDYENGTVLPDEGGLKQFLEGYRHIWEVQWLNGKAADAEMPDILGYWGEHFAERSFTYLFWNYPLITVNAGMLVPEEQGARTNVLPDLRGGTAGEVTVYAAINAGSERSDAAWALMERMLGETMQERILSDYDNSEAFRVPVRKDCLQEWIDAYWRERENAYVEDSQGMLQPYLPIEESIAAAFEARMEEAVSVYNSQTVIRMLWDTMQPYFEGSESYDSCVTELREKLTLYAGE